MTGVSRTQTKVTESLVYSLFGLTDDSSPFRTALEVTLALNGKKGSPFYNRIKLYGNYEKNISPTLSQATMVKSIVKLISKNFREAEKEKFIKREKIEIQDSNSLPFRRFYANDQDDRIAQVLNAFFSAVKETFRDKKGQSLWEFKAEQKKPENILQTTVGFNSLLNVLKDILSIISEEFYFDKEVYMDILSTVQNIDFTDQAQYPFTAKTKNIFTKDIQMELLKFSDDFHHALSQKLGIHTV